MSLVSSFSETQRIIHIFHRVMWQCVTCVAVSLIPFYCKFTVASAGKRIENRLKFDRVRGLPP